MMDVVKKRYVSKLYDENNLVECLCGCGQKFPLYDKEGRKRKYIIGHSHKKYEDLTQYKREWNHRNRESRYEYKKAYIRSKKGKLIELEGNKCSNCGLEYDGENACMFDFHHKDPNIKSFPLGLNTIQNKSWASILDELVKCDLLCSNCHRMIIGRGY